MNAFTLIHLWKPILEVSILWFVIYHLLLFFEGTRARQIMRGISILLVAFFVFQKFNFVILDWLLTKLFGISVIALIVIFHPEIRQGLARLGQRHLFVPGLHEEEIDAMLHQITAAVDTLRKNKEGALIAIEKNDPLTAYIESGVLLDALVSSELLESIFNRQGILHDGGTVIQHGRVAAAGCLFPLTENQELSRIFGTRHRAALGLSEETDAIIVVVSEERQDTSIVYRGRLYRDLSKDALAAKIKEIIKSKKDHE